MKFAPEGIATGIGSLPLTEPSEAVRLVRKYLPEAPHWPQLPQRGRQEHFVNQFLRPLVTTGLLCDDGEKIYFRHESPGFDTALTEFYTIYLAFESGDSSALKEFALPPEAAAGFYAFLSSLESEGTGNALLLKGHVVGPLTVGFQVKDERGRFAYYSDMLRDLIVKTITLNAIWQVVKLSRFGLPVLVFVDDPALGVFGHSSYITVTREMIEDDLSAVLAAVRSAGGFMGLHCCDAIDWSIPLGLGLDVLSFDAYNYFSSLLPYTGELERFLTGGGMLAWGIVPTSPDDIYRETEDSLINKLRGEWKELADRGVPQELLSSSCLITPACGVGLLGAAAAERVYFLTQALSRRIREGVQD